MSLGKYRVGHLPNPLNSINGIHLLACVMIAFGAFVCSAESQAIPFAPDATSFRDWLNKEAAKEIGWNYLEFDDLFDCKHIQPLAGFSIAEGYLCNYRKVSFYRRYGDAYRMVTCVGEVNADNEYPIVGFYRMLDNSTRIDPSVAFMETCNKY